MHSTAESEPRGSKDYVRFIILSAARTGSYMLSSALNSSPNIICFGELFNPLAKQVDFHVDGYDMADAGEREFRNRDFRGFLRERIFCKQPVQIGAVGFKAPHSHFHRRGWLQGETQFHALPELLEWLVEQRDIHVLHLRRRNMLRMLVSLKVAMQTMVWVAEHKERPAINLTAARMAGAIRHPLRAARALRRALRPPEPSGNAKRRPLNLTEQECREFFAREEADTVHYDERFKDHRKLTLYYEDLRDRYDATMRDIQVFLGLEPTHLTPMTRQQNPEPLRELIENYDELYQAFAGTVAAAYFD